LAVTTSSGTVTVPLTGTGAPKVLPDFTSTTWTHNGAASVSGSTSTLTLDSHKFAAGDIINSQIVSPIGIHATFNETISGTAASGGDGLTLALLDASATKLTSLGASGSSLGVGKLPATFVSLQTHSGNGFYSSNFLAVGTASATTSTLTLLGTNKAIPVLRGATHLIDVKITTAGHVVVSIDGTQVLDVAVPSLPPTVRVAYTAGTGSVTDTHMISNPTISYTG
jgi:hypothetical protein